MRGVNFQEAFSRKLCQARNRLGAIINRHGQAAAIDDARLAHSDQLLSGELSVGDYQRPRDMAALQPLAQILQSGTKAVLPEGIRQVWKFFCFRNQYAIQSHRFRVEQQVDCRFTHIQKRVLEVMGIIIHQGSECLKLCARLFNDESREQISFAGEVIIQRSFGNAGLSGDMRHRGAFVAMRQKDLLCSSQNLFAFAGGRVRRERRRNDGCLTWCLGTPLVSHKAPAFFRNQTAIRIMLTEQVGQCKNISVSGV